MPISSSGPNAPDNHRIGKRAVSATPQPAAFFVSAGGVKKVPSVRMLSSLNTPRVSRTRPLLLYDSRPSRSGSEANAGLGVAPVGVLICVNTPATEVY